MRQGVTVRASAPEVAVVDGCCAGAVFSAGYIYGLLRNWSLLETVRFATAAATLSCKRIGPQVSQVQEVVAFAKRVDVRSIVAPRE